MAKPKSKKKREKKQAPDRVVPKKQYQYLLDITFVLITGAYILALLIQKLNSTQLIENSSLLNYLWLGAIGICSILLIWSNKNNLDKHSISNNSNASFAAKFPKLNKLPIVKSLGNSIYKQGLWTNVGLLILTTLAAVIYAYDLGFYNWLPDEPLVVKAAKGFIESGSFNKWDFWNNTLGTDEYSRAWPHTMWVALFIKLFGLSEITARAVSAVCGVLTVPILYYVSNFFLKNRLAAFVITLCFIFHPYPIHYFRRTRMYAVLIPLFLGMFYIVYKAITEKKSYSNILYKRFPKLNLILNFHWAYVLVALLLMFISYEVHKISVIIFPSFLLFFIFLIFYRPEKRLLFVLVLGAIPCLYLLSFENVWQRLLKKFGTLDTFNTIYTEFLFQYPVSIGFFVCMFAVAIFWIIVSKQRIRLIAILILVFIASILYICFLENAAHYRYVIHIIPFTMILCLGMALKVNQLLKSKFLRFILPVLFIVSSVSIFIKQFEATYYNNIEAMFPKAAYPTITKHIKPNEEAIFALYFSDIYMQGMGSQIDLINILNRRRYSLGRFNADLQKYKGAWVTWATVKTNHLDPDFINYLVRNCHKYHGYGVDDTRTEVFYCKN